MDLAFTVRTGVWCCKRRDSSSHSRDTEVTEGTETERLLDDFLELNLELEDSRED